MASFSNVPIQGQGEKSVEVMVGQVPIQVKICSSDVDAPAVEAKVKGVDLMTVSSDSFEKSTKVEGGESTLKKLNNMGLAPGHHSRIGGASVGNIILPGPSNLLLSSTPETLSDRIKLRRRNCAVPDYPPTSRMNLRKEDKLLSRKKKFDSRRKKLDVEQEACSPDSIEKVRPRDGSLIAGKESHVVVQALMAAPYCPWRNGGVKMEQPKRKSASVAYSSQHSEGRSKRKAFCGWLDTEGSSGSSAFLKNEDNVAFMKQPERATPISMITPDLDHLLGKGCNVESSHSESSSEYEEGDDSMSGSISTSDKTSIRARCAEETEKNNPLWLNKSKAVARDAICSEKNWGINAKDDFPADSLFSGKTKDFDIRLPGLGPKNRNCGDARSRVKNTLMYFHCICRKILQKEEAFECKSKISGKRLTRVDLAALNMIKDEGKCVNTEKQILGEVPGVQVGDEFQFRAELAVVGMHRHLQNGIDSMEHDGISVAISIVTSGCYDDDTEHADVLIYTGQGGNVVTTNKKYKHQKLKRGNLALHNSKEKGTPVRVVRGWTETVKGTDPFDSKSKQVTIYYYDGLYTVKQYWKEPGSHGKLVYKFELTRNPGQPKLAWKELKKACKSKVREGVCAEDISHGIENFPICAVNLLDNEKPPKFTYTPKMMYPYWYRPSPPMGCNCVGKCNDSRECGCAIRNGGEIPYTRKGAIVDANHYVYECGPHCTCPPTCYNRVTQRGIKVGLEIFKTNKSGWGVRALSSVKSGTFICEYVGELLEDKEAEKRVGDDEYLFDIGRNSVDSVMNNEDSMDSVENAEESGGYTIDAFRYGNLSRFINHSCSPNLYSQSVIYDHDDDKMPHVMLFALENIPPFKELTYNYHYKMNQYLDSNGNVKIKECFCGSADCCGRLY